MPQSVAWLCSPASARDSTATSMTRFGAASGPRTRSSRTRRRTPTTRSDSSHGASSPRRTSPAEGAKPMRLELGINTCFAVKRWPTPADWGPIVGDRLELRLVQHSLDLVDFTADRLAEQADEVRDAIAA